MSGLNCPSTLGFALNSMVPEMLDWHLLARIGPDWHKLSIDLRVCVKFDGL